jgi:gamma-glutamyltranspeptidase/glutathione hydrolase
VPAIPAAAALGGAATQASEAPPTASLVVLDPFDQAVACSFTLGGPFGSGRMIPGTGLFAAVDRGAAGIGGPVIEVNTARDETLFMAAGASGSGGGGPAAAPAALVAVARHALNDGQAAPAAVAAPRVAPGGDPGSGLVEQAAEPTLAAGLVSQGLRVETVSAIGRAAAVNCLIDRKTDVKTCLAASDPRGFGLAVNIER